MKTLSAIIEYKLNLKPFKAVKPIVKNSNYKFNIDWDGFNVFSMNCFNMFFGKEVYLKRNLEIYKNIQLLKYIVNYGKGNSNDKT